MPGRARAANARGCITMVSALLRKCTTSSHRWKAQRPTSSTSASSSPTTRFDVLKNRGEDKSPRVPRGVAAPAILPRRKGFRGPIFSSFHLLILNSGGGGSRTHAHLRISNVHRCPLLPRMCEIQLCGAVVVDRTALFTFILNAHTLVTNSCRPSYHRLDEHY